MKPHQLEVIKQRHAKRVGRGIGSGRGKTAGRGTKGQRSRSGGKLRPTFEGGQNPLVHRLPKQHGFKSRRWTAQLIRTHQLNRFSSNQILKPVDLKAAGLISDLNRPVRLVMGGELTVTVNLEIQGASRSAAKAIAAQKGKVTIVPLKRRREPQTKASPSP